MRNRMIGLCTLLCIMHSAHAVDLLGVYQQAQQSDPQLQAAEADRRAVEEAKPQSRALLFPTISGSANTTGNRQDISTTGTDVFAGSAGVSRFNSNGYTLSVTQPVYRRETFVQLEQADARIAQAEAQFGAAEQDLIQRTSTRYFDALAAQDNLEFARAEKTAIARQLEENKQRFEVGLAAITDVQEAQARYDAAVAQEIEAERQLAASRQALAEITGAAPEQLAPLEEQIPLVSPQPADVDKWVNTALEQNLQIRAAQQGAEIARHEIERQRSGHYPTLDIVGSRAFSDTGGGRFGGSESTNDAIGLQLNAPLFQGGLVSSRTREAEFRHTEARARLEQQQRAVLRQTQDAYLGVNSNVSRVEALRQAVISNETALESTQAGLEVGIRTNVDVLNAQRELFRTRRDYARARYDYILETLRLKQAAGTLSPADVQQINDWLK